MPDSLREKISERLILIGAIIFAVGLIWSNILGYLGVGLGLVGICVNFNGRAIPPIVKKMLFLFCAFLLWGLILSLIVADYQKEGLAVTVAYASHWLLPFALGFWLKGKYQFNVLRLFTASIILVGILSLGAYLGIYANPNLSKEGMIWGLHHHVAFAAMLLMAFHIIYGNAMTPGISRFKTVSHLLIGILIILLLVFTGSRAYWLAGGITIAGATIYRIVKGNSRTLALAFIGAGILVVIIGVLAFPQVRGRTTMTEPNLRGLSYRKNMAIMAWSIIKDHPMFGIGPGQVPFAKEYYARMDSSGLSVETGYLEKKHLHNMYLQIAAEFGIPGLLIFLGILIGSIWISVLAISRAGIWAMAGFAAGVPWIIIAIAIGEIFDCLLRGPSVAMMIFFLIGISASNLKDDNLALP
jgi:O-antigen ligase